MVSEAVPQPYPPALIDEWFAPTPPTDLIFDDGEPLESNRHRIAMNVLIDSALMALVDQPNSFVGGNMFVYYSSKQVTNRDFRGPDFFAVLDVEGERERKGWVTWEEDGRYPDVIIELLSPTTANVDKGEKKRLYETTFRTANYYIYDPFDPGSLEGWHLDASRRYQSIAPNDQGWLWCETLGLWVGTWEGRLRREPSTGTCHWLRFYDRALNVVPLQEEQAQQAQEQAQQAQAQAQQAQEQAQQERQRADRLAARLRELGEDPEAL